MTVEETIVMQDSFPSHRQKQVLPPQHTWKRKPKRRDMSASQSSVKIAHGLNQSDLPWFQGNNSQARRPAELNAVASMVPKKLVPLSVSRRQLPSLLSNQGGNTGRAGVVSRAEYVALQSQCDDLRSQLKAITQLVAEVKNGASKSTAKDEEQHLDMDMGYKFQSIQGTLGRLETVFIDAGELVKLRWAAATKIQASARRYVYRTRFVAVVAAVRRWRCRVGASFLEKAEGHRARLERNLNVMKDMRTRRSLKQTRAIFILWRRETRKNEPKVRAKLASAMRMLRDRNEGRVGDLLRRWCDVANGEHSRKNVRRRYVVRYREARARIQGKRLQKGVITKREVIQEMEANAIQIMRKRHLWYIELTYFRAWDRVALGKYHWNCSRADKFRFSSLGGKVFDAWRFFVARIVAGLPTHGIAPQERFVETRSRGLITQHWRRTHLRKHLRHWRKFAHPRQVVRRRMVVFATQLARVTFEAWRDVSDKQKRAKQATIDEWRDYSTRLIQVPFRAWFVWAHDRRQRRAMQRAVVRAFHRRQKYHKKTKIFKMWKHLAVFGKVEGLKSRVALIKALENQNVFAQALEDTIERLQDELEISETSLKEQQEDALTQLARQTTLEEELQQKQFAIHHAEQEVVRLQSTLDALSLMYPSTVKELGSMSLAATLANPVTAAAASAPKTAEEATGLAGDLQPFVRLRVKERLDTESPEENGADGLFGNDNIDHINSTASGTTAHSTTNGSSAAAAQSALSGSGTASSTAAGTPQEQTSASSAGMMSSALVASISNNKASSDAASSSSPADMSVSSFSGSVVGHLGNLKALQSASGDAETDEGEEKRGASEGGKASDSVIISEATGDADSAMDKVSVAVSELQLEEETRSVHLGEEDRLLMLRCKAVLAKIGVRPLGPHEVEAAAAPLEPLQNVLQNVSQADAKLLLAFIGSGVIEGEQFIPEAGTRVTDLLSFLALQYPMTHPLNATAKSKVQARAAAQQARYLANINNSDREEMNIYRKDKPATIFK